MTKMPTINRPLKKKSTERDENTPTRELRKKVYNTTRWRKLRQKYIQEHPLCEVCLSKGIVNGGSAEIPLQVHHKEPFIKGMKIDYDLAFDEGNLMTICAECHGKENRKGNPEEILAALEEFFNTIDDDED